MAVWRVRRASLVLALVVSVSDQTASPVARLNVTIDRCRPSANSIEACPVAHDACARRSSITAMTLEKTHVARRQLGVALALFLEDLDPIVVHVLACTAGEIAEC